MVDTGWLRIDAVAEKLNTDESKARILANHFGVEQKEQAKAEGAFGKPAKLYSASDVAAVAGLKIR